MSADEYQHCGMGRYQPQEVEDMAKEFAARTHFVHLRNVTKAPPRQRFCGARGLSFSKLVYQWVSGAPLFGY